MAQPLDTNVTDDYVKHSLQLIRVANGLVSDANSEMRALALRLRSLLLGNNLATLPPRKLRAIVAQADDMIVETFSGLKDSQLKNVAEIIDVEVKWAEKTGKYTKSVTEKAVKRRIKNFTTAGSTIDEQFDQIAHKLHTRLVAELRQGQVAQQTDAEIVARVVGTAENTVAPVAQATKEARAVVDQQTWSAAGNGQRAAQAANGINALQAHAILDAKVCPSCGERHDMIWDMDGKPLNGHDLPFLEYPLHPWCRCIYLPLQIPAKVLEKGLKTKNSFGDWLETQSEEEQDHILGAGRAQLWRDGKITLADLIGQNGMVMSLKDLRATLKK